MISDTYMRKGFINLAFIVSILKVYTNLKCDLKQMVCMVIKLYKRFLFHLADDVWTTIAIG